MYKLIYINTSHTHTHTHTHTTKRTQDGHVAFPDFQQFFLESNQPYADMDMARQAKARPTGVPSQILRDWAAARKGGPGQAAWFSQFHQGDWQGPFKGHPHMSACKLDESARFQKSFAPQYVDETVLRQQCRMGKSDPLPAAPASQAAEGGLAWQQLGEQTSVEVERSRAAKLIKQACLTRKQEHLDRVQDQIREREAKMMLRDHANVEKKTLSREDWVQRCQQAYFSSGNKYGKGYREPEVRHAFYAPTKLHYYPEGNYPQFDRSVPSV